MIALTRVKITVFRRVDPSVIFDGEVPNMPGTDKPYTKCTAFEEGQEFIVDDSLRQAGTLVMCGEVAEEAACIDYSAFPL